MPYSRFFLADLQVHTPADPQHGYGNWGGAEPNPDFAKKLVEKCLTAGLSVIAVTDHNRVNWYPCLRDEASKHGIFVFPGAEVSVNRCHLLIVWDRTDKGHQLAETFLDTCWKPGTKRFEANGDARPVAIGQVADVAERAADHLGLVLAPHSTQKNIGFFFKGVCTNRREVIDRRLIAGFDVHGNPKQDVLTNPQGEFSQLPVPWFISGDTRTFDEIGQRACYLKLGHEPTLEGLRQAFLMPETRIRFPSRLREAWGHVPGLKFLDSPEPSWSRLTAVEVEGGFHDGLKFPLAPGLNAIIGGRGTGKSALIEIIRYVTESKEASTPDLVDNRRHNFKANAEGRVQFVDKQGQQYAASRSGGAARGSLLRDGEETGVPVDRRFKATIFGQRELQLLGDEGALREFVASTSGDEWQQAEAEEKKLREGLKILGDDLERVESVLERLEEKQADLADCREKLEQARKAGAESLLEKGKTLNQAKLKVEAALEWPDDLEESLAALTQQLPPPPVPETTGVPAAIGKEIVRLAGVVEKATKGLEEEFNTSAKTLEAPRRQWEQHVNETETAINKALAEAGVGDAEELSRIQEKATILEEDLKALPAETRTRTRLQKERADALQALGKLSRRKSRSVEEAARVLDAKLSGRVRLKVDPLSDSGPVTGWLREPLRGASVPATQLAKLAAHPTQILATAIRSGAKALAALGCTAGTAGKIVDRVGETKLRQLEEFVTRDRISAEVNLGTKDKEAWKSVEEVSPGQRATAMLALVLLSGTDPLVIDQPEDDLDNQYIYQDVVRLLADVSERRQVIVATHNANIPVLGDAELIVAFNADADRARIEAIGGFENKDVAAHARRLLEGGDDAFLARQRRYRSKPE